MSTAALPLRATGAFGLRGSLSRNRRWALITSYVFLTIFAMVTLGIAIPLFKRTL